MNKYINSKNLFNVLIKTALIIYILVLIFSIMIKSIMVEDLVVNFNYLSTFTMKERFIRGIKLIEFYKIEYELCVITRTIILDLLNCIVFVPFGIFITHLFKKNRIMKVILVTFCFSLFIEMFQLVFIIGAFMLNDLILNILGGLIGSILYLIITKNKKYKVYNILVSIFIIIESIVLVYLFKNFINDISVYKDLLLSSIGML
jgi:glycopeptide antibiotics resistance protein